jgi:hypothetical protein
LKSYLFSGLTAGDTYDFIVYARNAMGYSLANASISIIVGNVPPQMDISTVTVGALTTTGT